jgi:hypothetical protein
MFSRARPAGFVGYTELLASEMEVIDTNQARSLDAYAGGTYNPSAFIQINQEFVIDTTTVVAANATGLTVTGKGNEPGISATGGATAGNGVVGNGGVNGIGGYFTGNGAGSGVVGRGGATGNGVEGVGFDTAFGGTFTGGGGAPLGAGFSCAGVYGEGGAHAPFAVTGDGNCCGLVGVGGSANTGILKACAGVFGVGGPINGGCGVIGQAGLGGYYGVLGTAGTGGIGGVYGDGNSLGNGVFATGGSAAGAALHIDPQAAHPAGAGLVEGDMWIRGSVLYVCLAGVVKTVTVS